METACAGAARKRLFRCSALTAAASFGIAVTYLLFRSKRSSHVSSHIVEVIAKKTA